MKALVIGVTRMTGTSKKTGRPYDMARCHVLQPCQIGGTQETMRAGFGFQAAELDLRPDAITKFGNMKFPVELELITGSEMMFGRLITIVEGFAPPAVKPAA
jgi:hypothetical protein